MRIICIKNQLCKPQMVLLNYLPRPFLDEKTAQLAGLIEVFIFTVVATPNTWWFSFLV